MTELPMMEDAIEILEATGFIRVTKNPRDPSAVVISASPKLIEMIKARAVTLADISYLK